MTVITHARRKSALSRLIDAAGGVSVGLALSRARGQLDQLQPRALSEVSACISELEALVPPPSPNDPDALRQAYRAANGVIDAAGPFDLADVCAVAAGLCDMIDAATPERPFDWRVVPVCARTVRLLIALPADAAEARAVVRAELDQMVERKLTAG
jgi:hypothetical protein